MINLSEHIRVRLTPAQLAKMAFLERSTRLNASQVLRSMIDAAEIVPAQVTVKILSPDALATNGAQ